MIQNSVVEKSKEAYDIMKNISQYSRESVEDSENITKQIDNIHQVVMMNSATAQQSSAASEELSNQAQGLRNMISVFNILEESVTAEVEQAQSAE